MPSAPAFVVRVDLSACDATMVEIECNRRETLAFCLTKYGRREIVIMLIVCHAAMFGLSWLFWPAMFVPAALLSFTVWFFRDPRRTCSDEPGLLISPADGRVAEVTQIGPDSILGRDGVRVSVFMNVFNVHVNRSPAEAVVTSVNHRKGAFLDVRAEGASEKNEAAEIHLEYTVSGRKFPLVVRQIAGLVARRIVTDLQPSQQLARGQRIGMIKFGSRLELLVPSELVDEVCVKVGQPVKAGSTVLVKVHRSFDTNDG